MDELQDFMNRCPPAGGDKRFVVVLNGTPYASFDTEEEALAAKEMYAKKVRRCKGGDSYNSVQSWAVRDRRGQGR